MQHLFQSPAVLSSQVAPSIFQGTGGKHKACGPNPALHLVLSGPSPCFYPAATLSSLPLVKEWLHYTVLKLHLAL